MKKASKTVLKRKIDRQVARALEPAEVTLTVNGFKDVLAVNGSPISKTYGGPKSLVPSTGGIMRMKKKHPRVWIDPKNPDNLMIRPKGATIRFTIKPDLYFPIGIAFKLEKGVPKPDDLERIGFLNFEQAKMPRDRHTLSITDRFKDDNKDDRYKFSVVIQRTSDCSIGIIDPGIVHLS